MRILAHFSGLSGRQVFGKFDTLFAGLFDLGLQLNAVTLMPWRLLHKGSANAGGLLDNHFSFNELFEPRLPFWVLQNGIGGFGFSIGVMSLSACPRTTKPTWSPTQSSPSTRRC